MMDTFKIKVKFSLGDPDPFRYGHFWSDREFFFWTGSWATKLTYKDNLYGVEKCRYCEHIEIHLCLFFSS
jgi:hypothetical protein